jgi:hypothetical protein
MRILERRLDLQEQQIDALLSAVKQISDTQDFDRQLAAPRGTDPAAR